MQDIRKPYTRSRSSNDLQSRVEQFESARYRRDDYDEEPVHIPVKKSRRDLEDMDMYPKRKEEIDEEEYFDDAEDRRPSRSRYKKKNSLGTVIFIVVTLLLVIGAALYTYVFNTATITVVPKYKDVADIGKPFIFSKNGADPNAIPFIIETKSLSKTKTLSMSESRKVEAKASGKAVIYNNHDSQPQKLIKNTRFESTKGKIYRINQSVEVPGKKGEVPGSIEVTLYADSNGAEYNSTGEITFSIPGFKGSPRETTFYAKSKGTISGGSSGNVSSVSMADLNAAKDSLAVELAKEIQKEIITITKEGYFPLYSAVEVTYEDNEDEILRGVTGVYKVTATGNLMLTNESKFAEAIAKTFADYDNAPVKLINTENLTYTRKTSDSIVSASSTLSILVEGKPRIIWESDDDTIKEMVLGKKRDEFKSLMKTINSIESAEISFSPLWLTQFPDKLSKIVIVESLPKR